MKLSVGLRILIGLSIVEGLALGLGLLTLYKMLLSPLFTGSCRFVPSCSDYAREASSSP